MLPNDVVPRGEADASGSFAVLASQRQLTPVGYKPDRHRVDGLLAAHKCLVYNFTGSGHARARNHREEGRLCTRNLRCCIRESVYGNKCSHNRRDCDECDSPALNVKISSTCTRRARLSAKEA